MQSHLVLLKSAVSPCRSFIQKCFSSISRSIPKDGRTIDDFFDKSSNPQILNEVTDMQCLPQLSGRTFQIETYGCQMNKTDSSIMETLLKQQGMIMSTYDNSADVIIMNTCSVRKHAESRIWNRLTQFRHLDKKNRKHTILCVSGCMASRLKEQLQSEGVDVVVGPDSYTHLPSLLLEAFNGIASSHTQLSATELYSSIHPLLNDPLPTTQLTIMRGCNNMCSYCVVPYTRGRERSVPLQDIIDEVYRIQEKGYKEVLLLGQNVNSFCDASSLPASSSNQYTTSTGFSSPTSIRAKQGVLFPELLDRVAESVPDMRIRFMSPHPKDFPMDALHVIREHKNICRSLHLPLQSGSDTCLKRMNRPYTRDAYLQLIHDIRTILPDCGLSTDIITGFCGETEEEHKETMDLLKLIGFDHAFMYLFSMRENTHAWRHYEDDVEIPIKKRRLIEIQDTFYQTLNEKLKMMKGKREIVLVEGESKRSKPGSIQYRGRGDGNRMCVFDAQSIFVSEGDFLKGEEKGSIRETVEVGNYVACQILTPGSGTHIVTPLYKTSLQEYH